MEAVNCATNELNLARMMLNLESKHVAPFLQIKRKKMHAVTCSRTLSLVKLVNSDSLNIQFIWL